MHCTYITKFIYVSEQILRLSKHQMPFDLHLLQWFHETLQGRQHASSVNNIMFNNIDKYIEGGLHNE